MYERAFMEGLLDPFDFMLAEGLGMTVNDIRERMPNLEYTQWRAFYTYRAEMQRLAMKEPK